MSLLNSLLNLCISALWVLTMGPPSLIDVLKLRMFEMGLNQKSLSTLIGVSPSRLSDYISGKCEPILKVAREISRKLNLDANIVLGL